MAELSDARWEMFCRYISQGRTMVDSYELAGFVRSTGGASMLKKQPLVAARIKELIDERTAALDRMDPGKLTPHTAEAVRKGELAIDKEWVMAELVENLELARQAGQLAAANKAIELVGIELGMFGKGKQSDDDDKNAGPAPMIPIAELTRVLDLVQNKMAPGSLITVGDITPHITGKAPRGRPRTTSIGQGTQPKEVKARREAKIAELAGQAVAVENEARSEAFIGKENDC